MDRHPAIVAMLLLLPALFPADLAREGEEAGSEAPREVGLVERTGRGLVQLDVTVRGPAEAVSDLTAADFELIVATRRIDELIVDRVCREPGTTEPVAAETAFDAAPAEPRSPGPAPLAVSYLFYFDQHHLTMEGRVNAIEHARAMIPALVREGNRAAIVSNSESLETFVEMTDDTDTLLAGMDRLERDRSQWDIYAEEEEYRVREIMELLDMHGERMACATARFHQLEESYRTDKALRTFSMVLGLLAGFDPPKAVIYFADTARANSGQHYFSYARCRPDPKEARAPSSTGSQHAIDRVIQDASADSIRLYTVQAQGLETGEDIVFGGLSGRIGARNDSTGTPVMNSQRLRQAQDSLVGLALETGGRAFLNGIPAKKMVEAIEADLDCLYLVSFPRGDLPLDAPLRVLLRMKRPGVEARTRGLLVVQSESARRQGRLLSAFAAPGSVRAEAPLHGIVVPTGFENGRYTALVQLVAPGSPLAGGEWDLGASLISRGEFKDDASGRISVDQAGVPVIFETEMTFKPGPFELILVAHENVSDALGTARVSGSWPEPREGPGMGPIAVLQPSPGVFVRGGEVRRAGSLGKAEREMLRPDLQTALIGLVCRGSGKKKLRIERVLTGDSVTEFPPMNIEFGEERCTQIRDLIPAGTMTPGMFTYEIRVPGNGDLITSTREFMVVENQATLSGDRIRNSRE